MFDDSGRILSSYLISVQHWRDARVGGWPRRDFLLLFRGRVGPASVPCRNQVRVASTWLAKLKRDAHVAGQAWVINRVY